MSLEDWAFSSNASWCERSLERTERVISGSQSPRTVVDGRETLLAGSSDYLGLGTNRALADAAHEATLRAGGQEDRVLLRVRVTITSRSSVIWLGLSVRQQRSCSVRVTTPTWE